MLSKKDFLVILNPRSLSLKVNKDRYDSLIRYLSSEKYTFDIISTKSSQDIKEYAKNGVDRYRAILPIGGDGTLNISLNGMMENRSAKDSSTKLIPMPFGTGRDTFLGYKPDFAEGDWSWLTPEIKTVRKTVGRYQDDTGKIGYFINGLSMGVSINVIHEREKWPKFIKFRPIVYTVVSFIELFKYKAENISIKIDNKESKNTDFVILMLQKGQRIAGGMSFNRNPYDPKNREIELVVMKNIIFPKRIKYLLDISKGKLKENPDFIIENGSRICVNSKNKRIILDSDGEIAVMSSEVLIEYVEGIEIPI